MSDHLSVTVDKFTFGVATDRLYSDEGVWAFVEGNRVRIGISDFVQQQSGDVAFAEVRPEGTRLSSGDEVATIETIKVNVEVASPVGGVLVGANSLMETQPEKINMDPYGEGWLAEIEADNWDADREALLNAEEYFQRMKRQAEREVASG